MPETGLRLKPGQKLGDSYLQANLPTERHQLIDRGQRGMTHPDDVGVYDDHSVICLETQFLEEWISRAHIPSITYG